MFDLINLGGIFIPLLIGIGIFTLVGLFFYIYPRYINKNKGTLDSSDTNNAATFFIDDSDVIAPNSKVFENKKEKKKLEKENKIILRHYEKQLKKGEISVEEYKAYVNELNKASMNEVNIQEKNIVEDTVEEEIDRDALFNESEDRLTYLFFEYYKNTSDIYSLESYDIEDDTVIDLLNEKIRLLSEIEYVANHNIEFIGNYVEGLLDNRYEIKTLIQLELKEINKILNNEEMNTNLNLYFLENYVLLYNQEYFSNEEA